MNAVEDCILELREKLRAQSGSPGGEPCALEECQSHELCTGEGEDAPITLSLCEAPAACVDCLHRHRSFELVYVYRGSFRCAVHERAFQLREGDLMLLAPNAEHAACATQEGGAALSLRVSANTFEKYIIPMMTNNQMFMRFFVDYLYRGSQSEKCLLFDHNPPLVGELVEQLVREYCSEEKQYQEIAQSFVLLLFCYLAREYEDSHNLPVGKNSSNVLIYEIITYISQHSATATLETLSQQFQYSPGYLSRLIRKQTGSSFSQILHYHKFNLATHYLETTALPIAEIAHQVGFTDAMHFNKAFKLRFGKTPTEYRKASHLRETSAEGSKQPV